MIKSNNNSNNNNDDDNNDNSNSYMYSALSSVQRCFTECQLQKSDTKKTGEQIKKIHHTYQQSRTEHTGKKVKSTHQVEQMGLRYTHMLLCLGHPINITMSYASYY